MAGQPGDRAEVGAMLQCTAHKAMSKRVRVGSSMNLCYLRLSFQSLVDATGRQRTTLSPEARLVTFPGLSAQVLAEGANCPR